VFTCVGTLAIGEGVKEYIDEELLGWWLCERQCDSGGLNGRPEKQVGREGGREGGRQGGREGGGEEGREGGRDRPA